MNIKPLADRVLILPAPAEEKTIGGIIIPDTAKEKPLKGEVVAVGHGTKDEGTGIGLSLCRQIIKRHGGNFYLQESRQGKTIFVIEWPVASFILKSR